MTYTYDGRRFYDEDYDEYLTLSVSSEQETEYWEVGGTYYFAVTVTVYGCSLSAVSIPVTITENPYKDATVQFIASDGGDTIEAVEGVDSDTDCDDDDNEFQYYSVSNILPYGDQIVITASSGDTLTYTYSGSRFYDKSGNRLYYTVTYSPSQYEEHWVVGGTYVIILDLYDFGLTLNIPVSVIENPYISAAVDISESGRGEAVIETGGGYAYFTFTPSESGYYQFYSTGDYDTYAYLYDAEMNLLDYDDDDGTDNNALISYALESGNTYYIAFRFYSSSDTGSFYVYVLQEGKTSIADAEISSISSQTYTDSAITPAPAVTINNTTLTSGTDYTVTYSNNTNVGTATVEVTGIGDYEGSITATFTITAQTLSSSGVTLEYSSKTYTGSAFQPSVTVKNAAGSTVLSSSYTVTYSNNKNTGKATVTIKGKGNYSGTITKTFKILPKTMKVKSVKSTAKKKMTVKWTKASGSVSGYQIRYRVKGTSKWTTVTVSGASKTSKTISGLKSGKTYQVQIRAYKKVSSTKYYSASWSSTKTVKVK